MAPAHQRLETRDGLSAQIDEGLEVQLELVALQRRAQVRDHQLLGLQFLAQFRAIGLELAAGLGLGLLQSQFAVLHRARGIETRDAIVPADDHHADGDGDRQRPSGHADRTTVDRAHDGAREALLGSRLAVDGEQDAEFVAVETSDRRVVGHERAEPLAQLAQEIVAGRLPERRVHGVEVLDVDGEDDHLALDGVVLQHLVELGIEVRPAGQPRQPVLAGQAFHLPTDGEKTGHVLEDDDRAADLRARVAAQFEGAPVRRLARLDILGKAGQEEGQKRIALGVAHDASDGHRREELGEGGVDAQELARVVQHAEGLRHVVQRSLEPLALAQQLVLVAPRGLAPTRGDLLDPIVQRQLDEFDRFPQFGDRSPPEGAMPSSPLARRRFVVA